jgi:hypothetical protein
MDNKVNGTCSIGEGNMKCTDNSCQKSEGDLSIDRRIAIKCIFGKEDVSMCAVFLRVRIGSSTRHLRAR